MDFKVRLSNNVYRHAKKRAGGTDHALELKIQEWVINYATANTSQEKAGRARWEGVSPEARQEQGRQGAAKRWSHEQAEPKAEA